MAVEPVGVSVRSWVAVEPVGVSVRSWVAVEPVGVSVGVVQYPVRPVGRHPHGTYNYHVQE